MLRKAFAWFTVLVVAGVLAGCTSSYVDPKYKNQQASDLKQPDNRQRVRLEVEFQTNGKPNSWATSKVRQVVADALTRSRTVVIVAEDDTAPAATMRIVMNNVGDMGEAFGKGFGTGLTFGLMGSMVTDGYQFDGTFIPEGSTNAVTHRYEHAIYSTVGNKEGPRGLEPLPIAQAFEKVVNDLVVAFLKDLQNQGYLVYADGDLIGPLALFTQDVMRLD